ncbi:MAG: hypothetical protein ACE1ZA_18110, partial [Pseudomonadales bacterium]
KRHKYQVNTNHSATTGTTTAARSSTAPIPGGIFWFRGNGCWRCAWTFCHIASFQDLNKSVMEITSIKEPAIAGSCEHERLGA